MTKDISCKHHWGWFMSEESIDGFRKWIRCSKCKLTLDDFTEGLTVGVKPQ